MSDWDSMKAQKDDPMKPLTGDVLMAPGAGLDLIMPGREDQIMALTEGVKKKIVKEKDLNRAAGNVLKLVMENTVVSV
jgi:beta-glucosidase-like glycosyl hydrolase